jgi:hypothetical protein
MIVVADACVLVAELNRDRGFDILIDPRLRVVVADEQWSETTYEIARRLTLRVARGRLTAEQESRILRDVETALDRGAYDFFGCGCPTWTVETLRAELAEL